MYEKYENSYTERTDGQDDVPSGAESCKKIIKRSEINLRQVWITLKDKGFILVVSKDGKDWRHKFQLQMSDLSNYLWKRSLVKSEGVQLLFPRLVREDINLLFSVKRNEK